MLLPMLLFTPFMLQVSFLEVSYLRLLLVCLPYESHVWAAAILVLESAFSLSCHQFLFVLTALQYKPVPKALTLEP